jgi:hypothetical protein
MEKEGLVVAPGGSFEGAVEYVRPSGRDEDVARHLSVEAEAAV